MNVLLRATPGPVADTDDARLDRAPYRMDVMQPDGSKAISEMSADDADDADKLAAFQVQAMEKMVGHRLSGAEVRAQAAMYRAWAEALDRIAEVREHTSTVPAEA